MPYKLPQHLFEIVSSDVLNWNASKFVVIVGHYLKWFQVKQIRSVTIIDIIAQFDELFTPFGLENMIRSNLYFSYTVRPQSNSIAEV